MSNSLTDNGLEILMDAHFACFVWRLSDLQGESGSVRYLCNSVLAAVCHKAHVPELKLGNNMIGRIPCFG